MLESNPEIVMKTLSSLRTSWPRRHEATTTAPKDRIPRGLDSRTEEGGAPGRPHT